MNELGFVDDKIGKFAVNAKADTLQIHKGMGTHHLQLQLEVKTPNSEAAGRLLLLETELFAPSSTAPPTWLGSATRTVSFSPDGMERPTLRFLLTSAQLLALEEHRNTDLNLELHIRGVLPQAPGYPGSSDVVEYISVAESRWRDQLAGLGRSLAFELSIPFPADNEPHQEAVSFLREAQRRLRNNDVDGALLEARRTVEYIEKAHEGWPWPGQKKERDQRTPGERWAWIRSALEDQASGALHRDAGTRDYKYSRVEAETLIAMATALLRLVP